MPKIEEKPTIRGDSFKRAATFERKTVDEKNRTVEVAFSSEIEVKRWFGVEILDHAPESVQLARLQNGGAVLMDHNSRDQVGVVESVRIDADRIGRAVIRFGKSARAMEIFQDVLDGIRKHISVGYQINEYKRTKGEGTNPDVVRATKWTPYEISLVSIPADTSVGVGRSIEDAAEIKTEIETQKQEGERKMPKKDEKTVIVKDEADKVDLDKVRAEAVKADRERISGIERAFAQTSNLPESLKREAIEKGMSEAEFRAAAFDAMTSEPGNIADQTEKEMRKAEKKEFSLVRAIMAKESGDWSQAGFEREMSQELARENSVVGGGLMVPMSVFVERGIRADMTTDAGLYGDTHMASQFINTLRAETQMGKLGARFLPGLVGSLSIPKKTGNAAFGFVDEGVNVPTGDVPVGKISMAGKHIGGVVPLTFEIMRQSSPAIEDIVRADMLEGIALGIDLAAFVADGTGFNPLGILNTIGIHTITAADTTGKVPTFAEVIAMETALEDVNALKGSLKYVMRPTIKQALKTAKKDAGSGEFVWKGNEVNGYAAHSTTQMPAKSSLFGNFSDVLIGMWGAVELIPKRNEKTGGLDIGVHHMIDIGVRRAESFCKVV